MTRRPRTRTEPEFSARPLLAGDTPEIENGHAEHRPGPPVPRAVRGLTILMGLWLVAAPWIWGYGDTGGGFDATWNDVIIGLLVTATGCAQFLRPGRFAVATPVGLGVWLAIAPFALAYNFGADSTAASLNDTIAGTLLTGLTVSGYLSARDAQRWNGRAGSSPR